MSQHRHRCAWNPVYLLDGSFLDLQDLEIRHCDVDARRDNYDGHDLFDLTAFNTDGFDVEGKDIWIHDCTVWNQD